MIRYEADPRPSHAQRIERYNPNKKMPLVRYVGGTWRVGGLLALSRAFGDAYMKSSLQVTRAKRSGASRSTWASIDCLSVIATDAVGASHTRTRC